MKRTFAQLWLVLFAVALLCANAFGDAQIIDFRCIMQYCHNQFYALAGLTYYDPNMADWTYEVGLGILDAKEFEMLSMILADPTNPRHAALHAAFAKNAAAARAAMGSTIVNLTMSTATSGPTRRQPIPGTSTYYGLDGVMGAYVTMGEWVYYDFVMYGLKTSVFGSRVIWGTVVGENDAYRVNYDLSQEPYVSMCGDADGDGVANCNEFWAVVPNSHVNAINPDVVASGITWSVWACLDANNSSLKFAYNPSTERVFVTSQKEMTWSEALAFTTTSVGGDSLAIGLCSIRDSTENALVHALAMYNTVWIGCSDAGNDTGSPVPNPDDWYWLVDPETPMTYSNWRTGEPSGINGGEDCGTMRYDGTWADVDGTELRRYAAIYEVYDDYPDSDGNGAPDAFEDINLDGVLDGFILYVNTPRPVWSWESRAGSGVFRFRFDTGGWIAEDVTATTYTPNSNLLDGAYTLVVQERDQSGNWVDVGSYVRVVDTVVPESPSVTGPAFTTDFQPTWNWTPGEGGAKRYRFGWVDGVWLVENVAAHFYTPPELAEGEYTLYVQERDAAYNWSQSGSFTVRVDITSPDPPVITTDGGNGPGNDFDTDSAEIILAGTASTDTAEIQVNGSSEGVTYDAVLSTWSFNGPLVYGDNYFEIVALDGAGNASEPVSIVVRGLPTLSVHVAPSGDDFSGTGTADNPWKTIAYALAVVEPYCDAARPITIQLAEGSYAERVVFAPYVHLAGVSALDRTLSVIAPPESVLSGGSAFAVVAADGAELRDLTVRLPLDAPPSSIVIFVNDVQATVENVEINGRDVPGSIGMNALGEGSSDSTVAHSLFYRLDNGIRAVETSMNIRENTFRDIRFDAVFIREPESAKVAAGTTLLLGDVSRMDETGGNCFENVSGLFVRNLSEEVTLAQMCNWGLDTEAEIQAKMSGNVMFVPFLNHSAESGSLVVSVLDALTKEPLSNATISLSPSAVPSVSDNTDGVYVVNDVAADAYTVAVAAPAYATVQQAVVVPAGDSVAIVVELALDGDEPGGGCFRSPTNTAQRALDSPMLAMAGVLLAIAGRQKRQE